MILIMIDPREFGHAVADEPTPKPTPADKTTEFILALNAARAAAVPCILFHSWEWPLPIGPHTSHRMLIWQIDEGRKGGIRHCACFVGLN